MRRLYREEGRFRRGRMSRSVCVVTRVRPPMNFIAVVIVMGRAMGVGSVVQGFDGAGEVAKVKCPEQTPRLRAVYQFLIALCRLASLCRAPQSPPTAAVPATEPPVSPPNLTLPMQVEVGPTYD